MKKKDFKLPAVIPIVLYNGNKVGTRYRNLTKLGIPNWKAWECVNTVGLLDIQ